MNDLQDERQRKLVNRTVTDYLVHFPAQTVSGLNGLDMVGLRAEFMIHRPGQSQEIAMKEQDER